VLPQGWRGDLNRVDDPAAQFETMVSVAREAEALGFDSVWLYDHLQPVSGAVDTTFECWTSLAAIARETERVRLGQLVTCNSYRNPALLAKMAATLDAASGGRVFLGLGAGWDQREYEAYGFPLPYPSTPERLHRLDEAARVITTMLREPLSSVDGRWYSVRQAVNVPGSRMPLMIGGSGEKVTLRIVAEHADACNLTDHTDPEFYLHKLRVLRTHCEAVGRDYDSILRTASFSVHVGESSHWDPASTAVGTPRRLVEIFSALVAAGIGYFILYFHAPTDFEQMRLFAREVLPHLNA
jgi:F420-dependent oxidoreductase-like protein